MKQRAGTVFLKGVVYLMGVAVVVLCGFALWAAFDLETPDFFRPLFIGITIPAIPFFIALYQSLKLLSYIDSNTAYSNLSVEALKKIKYCGIAISTLYLAGMPYIFYVADKDDAPGAVAIGFVIMFASAVISVFAGLLQKLLKNAIDIKSENDLTV